MKQNTLAVHAGQIKGQHSGSVARDIVLSTTFERQADGGYPAGFQYSRTGNPNRAALETAITALEGGTRAFSFASGLAAVGALFQTLSPGDHVLLPDDVYHGTYYSLKQLFGAWGLTYDRVAFSDSAQVANAIRPETKLVWVETPSNPLLNITDIAAITAVTRDAGVLCTVDNTWPSPILQRPLELGADIVMHSTTKYFGGHSDVLGGALVLSDKVYETLGQRLEDIQGLGGAVPSPFDCWLLTRSIPTMPLRVKQQSNNAQEIAEYLEQHRAVHTVYYPGLQSHPGHEVALKQMPDGFGGMLSFAVHGGEQAAWKVANSVKLVRQATSLGGVESLIEHRFSVEGPDSSTPKDLLRFSVGIEDAEDLIADLDQALSTLATKVRR